MRILKRIQILNLFALTYIVNFFCNIVKFYIIVIIKVKKIIILKISWEWKYIFLLELTKSE